MAEHHDYVTTGPWLHQAGRRDLVDDVADQFERAGAAWPAASDVDDMMVNWPRASRGWRSQGRLHPQVVERRATG